MTMTSIGDLAQHMMLRSRSAQLSRTMMQLTSELASGQVADVNRHLDGDIAPLLDIDRDLTRLSGFDLAISEAGTRAQAMQHSLSQVQSTGETLSITLIDVAAGRLQAPQAAVAAQASAALETMVAALNTDVAGRGLFSGTASDRAALAPAETLLSSLKAALPSHASAQEIRDAAQVWFDDPAGFAAQIYTGSDQSRSATRIGDGDQVALDLRADDPAFRAVMMETALAALSTDADLALTDTNRRSLLRGAGEQLVTANDQMIARQAELGQAQSRIEAAATRNAATRTSLDMTRTTMLEADPYDTALKLEEAQYQLESLYTVTARNARISLLSYLE